MSSNYSDFTPIELMLSSTKLLTAAIQKQGRPFPAPTLHRVRLLLRRANNRSPQPTLLQHPHQQHPHPARAERLGHHHLLSKNQRNPPICCHRSHQQDELRPGVDPCPIRRRAPHCCSAGEQQKKRAKTQKYSLTLTQFDTLFARRRLHFPQFRQPSRLSSASSAATRSSPPR